MNAPPEKIRNVCRWVEKAEHDLRAAEHTMQIIDEGLTDIVCFHCQQCAEKYLKALLVSRDIPFPKTHDLRRLLDLVRTHTGLDLVARTVLPLNRYTIEGRYPGDWEPINRQEAEEAVTIARHVRGRVREFLPQQALNDEI